ncbi:MAG: DUF4386 domain-containing protein [Deltaproteobacteria bacterium]
MVAAGRAGRIIGVLIIIQMVGGGLVNSLLEAPLFGAPGFLVNAAPHSQQIALGALLGLLTEALWVGVAVAAFPILWLRARALALWFVALAAVTLAVAVLENSAVMSMVSLSEAYTKASAADHGQFQSVRVAVASARNWAHYMGRIFDGVTIFLFYTALYRLELIPRALAGFGLIAVTLMLTSVGMPLFGHDVVLPMLAPLGLSQLIVAVWLITKGFRDQRGPGIEPSDL